MPDNLDLMLLRKRAGLDQAALGRKLSCSQSAISEFEHGKRDALPDGSGREDYLAALERLSEGDAA